MGLLLRCHFFILVSLLLALRVLVFNKISLLQFYRSSCRPGTLLRLFSLTSVRHGLRRHFYVCFHPRAPLASWWGCHISVACGGFFFPTFPEEISINVFK